MKRVKVEDIQEMVGQTFVKITIDSEFCDKICFYSDDGICYEFFYEDECCEHVGIEDICGNLKNLLDTPLTMAEESSNKGEVDDSKDKQDLPDWYQDYYTWTFYKFATVKGYVTIRWFGSSNGYYSEEVTCEKIIPDENVSE